LRNRNLPIAEFLLQKVCFLLRVREDILCRPSFRDVAMQFIISTGRDKLLIMLSP